MAQMLSNLIAEYAERYHSDAEPGARYEAQKAIEKHIIDEICEERAQEIATRSREIELTEEMKRARHDLTIAVVECVFLAVPVGLVGSHVYDLLRTWFYGSEQDFNSFSLSVGLLICLAVCAFILFSMFLNQVAKAVDSIREVRGNRG